MSPLATITTKNLVTSITSMGHGIRRKEEGTWGAWYRDVLLNSFSIQFYLNQSTFKPSGEF